MRYCIFCGAKVPAQASFCGNCGSRIDTLPQGTDYPGNPLAGNTPPPDAPTFISSPSHPAIHPPDAPTFISSPSHPTIHLGQENQDATPGQGFIANPAQFAPTLPASQPLPGNPPAYQVHPSLLAAANTAQQRSSHFYTLQKTASRVGIRAPWQWAVLALIAILIIASSGILFVHAVIISAPASLSSNGQSNVTWGQVLPLHGQGFKPGGSVRLTLDNGMAVSTVGHGVQEGERDDGGSSMASALQVLHAVQLQQPTAQGETIPVNVDGSFDTMVVVNYGWSLGLHTIRAIEVSSSLSTSLPFTIVAASLNVSPLTMNFGKIEKGRKAFLSAIVSNTGKNRLNWTADVIGTKWLKLQGSAGEIEPGGPQQFISVMADTSQLAAGTYRGTLHVHSNGGYAQVGINLTVPTQTTPKVAKLVANPDSLDFGQLPGGLQMTLPVTIANTGTQTLTWKAQAGSANWLKLDQSSGKIQPAGRSQVIQVTADTTNMVAAHYTTTLQISSNGGKSQVSVNVAVLARKPGRLTPPPAVQTANLSSFNAPGDPNCYYAVNRGWLCTVSLYSFRSAQSSLHWSASPSGSIQGVSFTPSSGTLFPGQTQQVGIFIPNVACPASTAFIFKGSANVLAIPWQCASPTLVAGPQMFNRGCRSCTVTLVEAPRSEGKLNWTTASSGVQGISFNPTSGTLLPDQQTQVVVTVAQDVKCPASAAFTFKTSGNSINVSWYCDESILHVSPGNFSAPGDPLCSYRANQGWNCTTVLEGDPANQRDIHWSSSSNGIQGITFEPG